MAHFHRRVQGRFSPQTCGTGRVSTAKKWARPPHCAALRRTRLAVLLCWGTETLIRDT